MENSYYFYTRLDKEKQPIANVGAASRYHAALFFAKLKHLPLKEFLKIFAISR